ncbi:MAG: redox-sensing transcriptional repressor Rex [Phycisphaerae bacterium]
MKGHVSHSAVRRLSLYLRRLEHLSAGHVETVSSSRIAEGTEATDAQVRKDLAYFGQFGRPGIGYRVAPLIRKLKNILGTARPWRVVVIGVGGLGQALLRYKAFGEKGFDIVAAFDTAPDKIGQTIGGVKVMDVARLPEIVDEQEVRLAILTVPADAAQPAADLLRRSGVRGILNFAPTNLDLPENVALNQVDLTAHLERLSFDVRHPGNNHRRNGNGSAAERKKLTTDPKN